MLCELCGLAHIMSSDIHLLVGEALRALGPGQIKKTPERGNLPISGVFYKCGHL